MKDNTTLIEWHRACQVRGFYSRHQNSNPIMSSSRRETHLSCRHALRCIQRHVYPIAYKVSNQSSGRHTERKTSCITESSYRGRLQSCTYRQYESHFCFLTMSTMSLIVLNNIIVCVQFNDLLSNLLDSRGEDVSALLPNLHTLSLNSHTEKLETAHLVKDVHL